MAVAVGGDVGAFSLGVDRMEKFAVVSILVVFCATGVVFVVSRAGAVGAVSYTHLDVYKRQD